MKRVAEMFDRFMENVLEEHNERRRREGDAFVAKDMVDRLLQLADDPDLEVKLTRDSVKAFTQDLVAGGTERAAVIAEWAISAPQESPRARPWLSRQDTSVGGYAIPAGTMVLVNVWTISRDPTLWEAPEEFRPERFVGSKIDVKGHDFELLPFGSGRRMCPGYVLGLKVIQVSLANLLHGFEWKMPHGVTKEELSMEEIFGLSTPRKFPLQAVVEPKLPAHLYTA